MKQIAVKQLMDAVKGVSLTAFTDGMIDDVVVDSRRAGENSLFVALPGEQTDGHTFVGKAFHSGASCALVSRMPDDETLRLAVRTGKALIRVDNTEQALMDLAEWYLKQFDVLRVGITGSVGKTTAKEMTARILETRYNVVKTEGNHNNNVGLPLTVFQVEDATEAVVLEMGMDKPGEIHGLAKVVRPDIAVITTIGTSHMEKLGSRQAICSEKCSITDFMDAGSTLIINDDNDLLHAFGFGPAAETGELYHLIRISSRSEKENPEATLRLSRVSETEEGISFDFDGEAYEIPLPGKHNAMNASLASAAGLVGGISLKESAKALETMHETTGSRLRRIKTSKYTVLDDTYNASPESMKAAIDTLMVQGEGRKVAILGDMYELGKTEAALHGMVGNYAGRMQVDQLLAVGNSARFMAAEYLQMAPEGRCKYYETKEECIAELAETLQEGDTVLVKASRGMAMETVVEELIK